MSRLVISLKGLIIFLGCISCNQEIPLRNKIIFQDSVMLVADSIAKMEKLLYKLPENERVNYFMDNKGNLFINNKKLGTLKGAINNSRIRSDESFKNFTSQEIDEFFNLMVYLLRNHIDGAVMELSVGKFVYGYRQTKENKFNDVREIIFMQDEADINSAEFYKTYQLLDKKNSLVLVAPASAKIR